MKTWLKRTLIGLAGLSVAVGGIAAAGSHRCGHFGGGMNEADSAQMRGRMVERAAKELSLDAAQKQQLTALADTLHAQRQTLMAGTEPRSALKGLIAGPQFDAARAQALVGEKTEALRTGSPAVIAAAASFFDGLRPEQQQKVREFLDRAGHGRMGAEHRGS
jgi:periplasmic protein CpxP/Spy